MMRSVWLLYVPESFRLQGRRGQGGSAVRVGLVPVNSLVKSHFKP